MRRLSPAKKFGLATIFLMTWVLPPLLENLQETVKVLPWPTRVAKALSDFVVGYGLSICSASPSSMDDWLSRAGTYSSACRIRWFFAVGHHPSDPASGFHVGQATHCGKNCPQFFQPSQLPGPWSRFRLVATW